MEDSGRSAFGVLLRRLRLKASLSQEALAERARMSVVTVGALERGVRRAPYRDTVALLADALALGPQERALLESAAIRPSRARRPRGDAAASCDVAGGGSPAAPRNNLPTLQTSFVGRETEVADITALLAGHRLVTLVGSGGIGKTRASLHVAANLPDGALDGVWLIELAPLSSGDYLPTTVAQAMGFTLPSEGDPVEHLVRALVKKRALLVFDNCEHLVAAAARAIAAILRGCPHVTVLASSRQGLGIAGEATYRVPPLAFPGEAEAARINAAEAARYPAIALFVVRAGAADRRFELSDRNAQAVAEICRRLDGIPLAIELAAARVKILSPRQICERLAERFRVLTGGSLDALPRQQTLRALVDWSYDLLDERERAVFRRLGIFANGFGIEAATAVGGGAGLDEFDVLEILASLVDKSLVLAEPAGEDLRYRLLESTRVYAREKLVAAGERDAVAARHLRSLRDRAAEASGRWEGTGSSAEIDELLAGELDDVRAALDWALAGPDARCGGELLTAIDTRWRALGLDVEGEDRLEAFATALAGDDPARVARLWSVFAHLAVNSPGRMARALEAATEAVAFARASGDSAILARALEVYARNAIRAQRFDAAEASLAEAEAIGGPSALRRLHLLDTRAFLSKVLGDADSAARAFEQLRKEHRALGNDNAECMSVLNLAEIEHARGNSQRAIGLVRDVLPFARAGADWAMLATLLGNVAGYLVAVGDPHAAAEAARVTIREFASRDPEFGLVAISAEHLALALALVDDLPRAARLAGYADRAMRRFGFKRDFTETTTHDRLNALLRERLAPQERERLFAEGDALTADAAIALALEGP